MKFKGIIIGLVILSLTGGCAGMSATATAPALVTVPPTQPQTKTPTITLTATPIPPTRTPTPSPSPTPTATPMNEVQFFCPSIEPVDSLPEIDGQLIMNSINRNHRKDLSDIEFDYLLDLKTGEKQSIATKSYNHIALPFYLNDGSALVSPDRTRFVYVEYATGNYERPQLRIINSKGRQEPAPAWEQGWDKIYGWADDQTLLFTGNGTYDLGSVFALQLDRGGESTLLNPLPHMERILEVGWYVWFGKPIIVFGPDLKKAIYLIIRDHPQGHYYALWDREQSRVLWEKPAWVGGFRPVWSSDGAQFGVSSGDENELNLFLVNAEGKEKQITELGKSFGVNPILTGALDWSPDGKSLAFWVQKRESTIAWIDIETKAIHSYCIEGQPFQLPIWSPDGKWLAVNSPIEKGDWNPTRVVLINIETLRAYELIREDKVIGWMKKD